MKLVEKHTEQELRDLIGWLSADFHCALSEFGLTAQEIRDKYPIINKGLRSIMKVPEGG